MRTISDCTVLFLSFLFFFSPRVTACFVNGERWFDSLEFLVSKSRQAEVPPPFPSFVSIFKYLAIYLASERNKSARLCTGFARTTTFQWSPLKTWSRIVCRFVRYSGRSILSLEDWITRSLMLSGISRTGCFNQMPGRGIKVGLKWLLNAC